MSAVEGDESGTGHWANAEGAGDSAEDAEERSYADGTVGLGVDIVEIERMRNLLARKPSFAEQVFSPAECAYCEKKSNPATHYALRFAAKEAVVKALGTGFSEGIWVHDIEVERAQNGKPSVKLSGRALEVADELGVRELSLSMSYTHTDAVACAMAVTDSAVRASEKRKDPMEELARQFKETRKMLDDL
ncbi:MAG: holo-ACP synthase [Eggerthellaceae bacterium]|nr:holo-ACP synthase [Eggerthellaceae bacterium]